MSWQSYIDNLSQQNVDASAICGKDNGAIWAANDNFMPTPEEVKTLTNEFNHPEDTNVYGTGVTISGMKCTVLRKEAKLLHLKNKESKEDIIVCPSDKTIIIGCKNAQGSKEGAQVTQKAVQAMSEHLTAAQF